MNPIIDPATLSEEQREAIRNKYVELDQEWRNTSIHVSVFGALCQIELMKNLFGSEFFKKGE